MNSPFLRSGLEGLSEYSSEPLEGVDLDLRDNINLWGAPPRALAAVRRAASLVLQSYPSVGANGLAEAIAAAAGVGADEVVSGCGSDDVIDACLRAVAAPGTRLAYADPTFSMIPVFARLNGLEPMAVPLLADGSADVDGLLATGARVIYLCSPNNPTGTVTPPSEIRRLVDRAPGIVILDEAYAEFDTGVDWRPSAPSLERVLVTRTFSKAWGLAGLRVGYGVGGRRLVAATARTRGPYRVNALAELAATTALREDAEWMRDVARQAVESRERLVAALQGRANVRAWDSRANFAFLQVDGSAAEVARRFAERGIGVRSFAGLTGVGDAVRIGVAPRESFDRVVAACEELWPCA